MPTWFRLALMALVRLAVAVCAFAPAVHAQTTATYSNTTTTTITDNNCPTMTTRTFTVSAGGTVADVNISVTISHVSRGNLRALLRSPAGTTVSLISNVGGTLDHLNVLFDDEAAAGIATHTSLNDDTTTTPYLRTFSPAAALSAFDGQSAAGTWTLQMCDSVSGTNGSFVRSNLYLATHYTDLSLAKSVSSSTPASSSTITYLLTVANSASATQDATGVVVRDLLPTGISFVSASGTGSYDSATGDWTVGTVPVGTSRTLTITAVVTAQSTTITNTAQVTAQSQTDLDSTPNNGATGEDDYASVAITVPARVAGTVPTLTCTAGTTNFLWSGASWTAGTTSNSYSVSNIGTVGFSLTNEGAWGNIAQLGGQSPAKNTSFTGGAASATSLAEYIDFGTISQVAATTITLATAVPGAQFTLFDVDYGASQFADRVVVTGTYQGVAVTPTLTNGTSNYVVGNTAYGDGTSADTSAAGNIVVTFASPVDTIVITYGNHALAPSNPGGQAIGLSDITFCRPVANISFTKVSSIIADGVNSSNFKAIPGATVRYCIIVTNGGSAAVTGVSISDPLPVNMTYVAASMSSGTSCASTPTTEDDNNIDGDESDPFGMAISGTTITGTASSLASGSSFAMAFSAKIN